MALLENMEISKIICDRGLNLDQFFSLLEDSVTSLIQVRCKAFIIRIALPTNLLITLFKTFVVEESLEIWINQAELEDAIEVLSKT